MVENYELRRRARELLGGGIFANQWLFAVLVVFLTSAVLGVTSAFILGILLVGIVNIGVNKYFLGCSRRIIKYDDLNVLTDGVKFALGDNIVLGLLISLFTFLWSLLFVIPGIVKHYSYSMSYFIKIDHPEYTPQQAIEESMRIMEGNKMRLFLLDLSFIGWIIVGSLCFGVGALWVSAYMQASYTEFYRDLMGENHTYYQA